MLNQREALALRSSTPLGPTDMRLRRSSPYQHLPDSSSAWACLPRTDLQVAAPNPRRYSSGPDRCYSWLYSPAQVVLDLLEVWAHLPSQGQEVRRRREVLMRKRMCCQLEGRIGRS